MEKFISNEFQLAILLTVARLGDQADGTAVWRGVDMLLGSNVSVGRLYGDISVLDNAGLLLSNKRQGDHEAKPRMFWKVSQEGLALLDEEEVRKGTLEYVEARYYNLMKKAGRWHFLSGFTCGVVPYIEKRKKALDNVAFNMIPELAYLQIVAEGV